MKTKLKIKKEFQDDLLWQHILKCAAEVAKWPEAKQLDRIVMGHLNEC